MTSKRKDVGQNPVRSGIKSGVLNAPLGEEVSARVPGAARSVLIDLNAGDGAIRDELPWEKGPSSGLMAHHARFERSEREILAILIEISEDTFSRLAENLAAHLPEMECWKQLEETRDHVTWEVPGWPRRTLIAWNADSLEFPVRWFIRPDDSVFLNHDPNSPEDWSMRPGLIGEITRILTWPRVRSLTTFIPAAGMLKGGLSRERREIWADRITDLENTLPPQQDMGLFRINGDSSQCSYLLTAPGGWVDKTEKSVQRAFNRYERSFRKAWLRQDPEGFRELKDQGIYWKKELGS